MMKPNSLRSILLVIFVALLFAIPVVAQEESNDAADTVKDKVQQKVEETLLNPKAYLGTITDITDSTLQIKTNDGEIKQIAIVEDSTTFLKINDEKEKVTFTDVAIGDYIVAMGFKDENDVLDAKRALITSAIEKPTRRAFWATVIESDSSEVSVKTKTGDEVAVSLTADGVVSVTQDGTISTIKLTDLEKDQQVIISGTDDADSFEARNIHVLTLNLEEKEQAPEGEEE